MTLEQSIGRTIRELCESRGFTCDTLAKRVGCCRKTISEVWNGNSITWPNIRDLSQVLGVEPGRLISTASSLLPEYEKEQQLRERLHARVLGVSGRAA